MHKTTEDRDQRENVNGDRDPATSAVNFTVPGRIVQEARRILLQARRTPLPGPAPARLSTRWILDSVTQQAMTQAGFTFTAAREFAARHGMTLHLHLTPAGARRFCFRLGGRKIACSTTIRGAFTEIAAQLDGAGSACGADSPPGPVRASRWRQKTALGKAVTATLLSSKHGPGAHCFGDPDARSAA
jgi:hypothetical protein